ncbi:MAG: hypothetical protein IT454_04250 [Planctomycetes bacterium]|nr:hypothetical protein [Planctomycetota bacterium]
MNLTFERSLSIPLALVLCSAASAAQFGQVELGVLPDADPNLIAQIRQQLPPGMEFTPGTPWQGGASGTPRVVTWSFMPDGVTVPSLNGVHPAQNSMLFAQFDAVFASQGGRAHWIQRVQDAFDRWEQLSGVDFQRISMPGVDWDAGAPWGIAGDGTTLGDIRIASISLPALINSYAYAPQDGEIVLASNYDFTDPTSANLSLRNTAAMMVGFALGLDHVCTPLSTQLMEGFITTAIDGPQQDDVRAVQFLYGDDYEANPNAANASPLAIGFAVDHEFGIPPPTVAGVATPSVSTLSIRGVLEQDWFHVQMPLAAHLDVRVEPYGADYVEAPVQGSGGCNPANQFTVAATQILDLELAVLDDAGLVIASANSAPLGAPEVLIDVPLTAGADYFVRVTGAGISNVQTYRLFVRADANTSCAVFSNYCTSSTSSAGCSPVMSASGLPSTSATSGFTLHCTQLEPARSGLLFYGVNGSTAAGWAPGNTSTMCVRAPVQRTGTQQSGGTTGCSGSYALDYLAYLAAHPSALGHPFSPGTQVWAQAWYRDTLAPGKTNLSDGLTWIMCP